MTPTTEGKQLAADLANAEDSIFGSYRASDCDAGFALVLTRLATEHLALKAKHEEALADLREIDRLAGQEPCNWIRERKHDRTHIVATIAAKWRVETDPLVEAVIKALPDEEPRRLIVITEAIRAELSKRGYEIGGKS